MYGVGVGFNRLTNINNFIVAAVDVTGNRKGNLVVRIELRSPTKKVL